MSSQVGVVGGWASACGLLYLVWALYGRLVAATWLSKEFFIEGLPAKVSLSVFRSVLYGLGGVSLYAVTNSLFGLPSFWEGFFSVRLAACVGVGLLLSCCGGQLTFIFLSLMKCVTREVSISALVDWRTPACVSTLATTLLPEWTFFSDR